jgi:hypothetical protein
MFVSVLPWRRPEPWRTVGLVGAISAMVIVLDVLTGSSLSMAAPLGDNPVIAGRFHGVGNIAFAVLATGTLLLMAALGAGLRPRPAAAAALALGAIAVVVDGYPRLGDDFGGVPALLPAVAVLALVVSRTRISWRHLLAVLSATIATLAAFALYDYSRPAANQTHVGRFVGQLADGSAWPVIGRKLNSSLATFTGGMSRWVVLVWLVLAAAAYVGHRRGQLAVRADVDRRTAAGLVLALVTVGFLGAALNDSGLAITAFVLYASAPVLTSLLQPVGQTATLPVRDESRTTEPTPSITAT